MFQYWKNLQISSWKALAIPLSVITSFSIALDRLHPEGAQEALRAIHASVVSAAESAKAPVGDPESQRASEFEEKALARIRALSPALSRTTEPHDQSTRTIDLIAKQGQSGAVARDAALASIGQVLADAAHATVVQEKALQAIAVLGQGSRQAIQILGKLIGTTDHLQEIRLEALSAIQLISTPETASFAIEALAQSLGDMGQPVGVHREVIRAVTRLGSKNPDAVSLLTQVLLDGGYDEQVQRESVAAIYFLNCHQEISLRAYEKVLRTTANPESVRSDLLDRVANCGKEFRGPAMDAAAAILTNPNHSQELQQKAVRTILGLGTAMSERAVDHLALAVRDGSFQVETRIDAIQGIGALGKGSRVAEEVLERVLNDEAHQSSVRDVAQLVLNQLYEANS